MTIRRFELDGRPFDLGATWRLSVLWGGTPWRRADETGVWYATRTPDGIGTVRVAHRGDHLAAEAWGAGADRLLDDVPNLVGLHDVGVTGIDTDNLALRQLLKRLRGFRLGRTKQFYPSLISVAIAQKVTGKSSKAALDALARRWGEQAPGPRKDLLVLPAPETLLLHPYYEFHTLNVERHRADLLRRIASRATALQRAVDMSFDDAMAHLQRLRGIGPWTAGIAMGIVMGDPDAVPLGDLHLPNAVAYNLAGEPRADDARMLELLEPYRGNRGRIVRMIKGFGRKAPRYGARSPVRDIRDS